MIVTLKKCLSEVNSEMTSAYKGIEQVCAEIQSQEERKSIVDEREQMANLALIYMYYNIGKRWERIKLFTTLQPQIKDMLFSCMFFVIISGI
jgi:uncharacterized membrane protein YgaE (UPF0421/DUF939 family)